MAASTSRNRRIVYRYEPEADVLSVELSRQRIDHATEAGNFVVHWTTRGVPVLIEILNASAFSHRVESLTRPRQRLGGRSRSRRSPAPIPA